MNDQSSDPGPGSDPGSDADASASGAGAERPPLLIKRYASRRLYNTETSDYVTLEDIARFIRDGRDLRIVDLKSGDDLTRQYLLQIVAEHESRGESVLPLAVLTDLVRSYTTATRSIVPQFLALSFEALREQQAAVLEKAMTPMKTVPGFEAMQAQQRAFFEAVTAGWTGAAKAPASPPKDPAELDEIRSQLADLQEKLARLSR